VVHCVRSVYMLNCSGILGNVLQGPVHYYRYLPEKEVLYMRQGAGSEVSVTGVSGGAEREGQVGGSGSLSDPFDLRTLSKI
jgi:hypothetical protein